MIQNLKVYKEHKNSLKSLKIKTPHRYQVFSLLQPLEMATLSNSRLKNRKERPNQSSNKPNLVDKARRDVVTEGVSLRKLIYQKQRKRKFNLLLSITQPPGPLFLIFLKKRRRCFLVRLSQAYICLSELVQMSGQVSEGLEPPARCQKKGKNKQKQQNYL